MRREFNMMFENIAGIKIPSYVLRSIYAILTNDATADQNPEIDERVRMSILGSDPELVVDLRHLNKGAPSDTFNIFFEQLEKEVNDVTAADERRHNVEHISQYLSVRDMIESVKSKVPAGTAIPSESTVLLAFVPKNAHTKVAKLYKGRVPLRLKVQTRQLRSSHQDDHYCSALFKYAREYAVKFQDSCNFICMDDKAKVDFGEPGLYASSGVRGKKSIVPMNSNLSCLDHDVQNKGSLTPSVILDVDVPKDTTDSFYRGQVTLTIKDSIFEPSSPFRHMVELQHYLEDKEDRKPCLVIYTDGGPDHRTTYHAVKLSLIVLFKRLGLEFLAACRTAQGNSWANPAERIMSLLNIAFQNTALARDECNAEFEQNIWGCNSMSEIRKKADKVDGLKESWLRSVDGIKSLLESRAERVKLKGKPFKCRGPAAADDLEMAEAEVTLIDPSIAVGKYQQQNLVHATEYKQFLATHCLERHYSFQIRRCDNVECCQPGTKWAWLPDPVLDNTGNHYKPFETSYGTETSEKDRPSSQNQTLAAVAQEQQGCKNSMLTAQNVRMTVNCVECDKPRCVYSKLKLNPRDLRSLRHTLERYDYTCGSVITPDGDAMQGKIFVRLQMSCSTPIEFPFYSSNIGRPDICCHCNSPNSKKR